MRNTPIHQLDRWVSLPPTHGARDRRYGFTLLEALIASAVLLLTVTAVSLALSSGRQYSLEAQDQLHAALAADGLMAEILAADYADMPSYDNHDETPGTMLEASGAAYPASFSRIGRRAAVVSSTQNIAELGVVIEGLDIAVECYGADGRVICTVSRFVPEPQSE